MFGVKKKTDQSETIINHQNPQMWEIIALHLIKKTTKKTIVYQIILFFSASKYKSSCFVICRTL